MPVFASQSRQRGSSFATRHFVLQMVSLSWTELGGLYATSIVDDDVLGLAARLFYCVFLHKAYERAL